MVTVGLCGGSGSGKGTLCRFLAEYGLPSFDCDAVYHEMISRDSEVTEELVSVFGRDIRAEGGGIDRRRLSATVFAPGREDALRTLNEVTHRHVRLACLSWLAEQREKGSLAAIVDAPLLFEAGFECFCDLTVAVVAPREQRIARIMLRDGIDRAAAERRIDAQIPDPELIRLADVVIENASDEAALHLQAKSLIQIIEEKKHEQKKDCCKGAFEPPVHEEGEYL